MVKSESTLRVYQINEWDIQIGPLLIEGTLADLVPLDYLHIEGYL